jgi:hypothetical protein
MFFGLDDESEYAPKATIKPRSIKIKLPPLSELV